MNGASLKAYKENLTANLAQNISLEQ